jgi:hypothetical protein
MTEMPETPSQEPEQLTLLQQRLNYEWFLKCLLHPGGMMTIQRYWRLHLYANEKNDEPVPKHDGYVDRMNEGAGRVVVSVTWYRRHEDPWVTSRVTNPQNIFSYTVESNDASHT